ncbi:hypothetical protein D3C87_2030670 [compost metagenome]
MHGRTLSRCGAVLDQRELVARCGAADMEGQQIAEKMNRHRRGVAGIDLGGHVVLPSS